MKFLIIDFSFPSCTEYSYICDGINSYKEHEAAIISPKSSIYDTADRFRPDVIISSVDNFSKPLFSYLQDNKNIKLVVNCSQNQKLKNLIDLEDALISNNINCLFLFGNNKPVIENRIPFLELNHCADINLINRCDKNILFNHPKAFMVHSDDDICFIKEKIVKQEEKFHIISNVITGSNIDISLPEMKMVSLYNCYEEIIFSGVDDFIPQAFFDAVAIGKKTYFISENNINNNNIAKKIDKLFNLDIDLNYNSENKLQDFDQLKRLILSQHVPAIRTKTLLHKILYNK